MVASRKAGPKMKTRTSAAPPEGPITYFAYGANLDGEGIRRRCPGSRPLRLARLMGHALRIALPQKFPPGPGWATTVPEKGAFVPGALYLLHGDDLFALDGYEDYPDLYGREEVEVESDQGRERAMIYRMAGPLRDAKPSAEYAQILRRGYRENGLPMAALEAALGAAMGQENQAG